MTDRPIYHRQEILAELRREYSMRRRLYPNWVNEKRLTQAESDRRLAILDQVIQGIAKDERAADLLGLRLEASRIASEIIVLMLNMATKDVPPATFARVVDRINRAMVEGK